MSESLPEAGTGPEGSRGRDGARHAVDVGVRVVWVDMSHATTGRIRDLSSTGARVALAGEAAAPRDIYLLVSLAPGTEPVSMVAQVRWQVGETIGVRFTPALPPDLVTAVAALAGG